MDPLTILFAYISTWVNSLNYTLGAAVIALAFLYFTRTLPISQRIAVPAIVGNGMSASAALFGAGVGTIVYLLFTKFMIWLLTS